MSRSILSPAIAEDRVRAVAYSLWLEEGQPEGRAEAHWLKAIELLNAEAAPVETPNVKPKRKASVAAAPARKAAPRKRG